MDLFPNLGIDSFAETRKAYGAGDRPGLEKARRAAAQFESLFLGLLLEGMEKAEGLGGFFGDSPGSQVQEGLFVSMLSRNLAENGPGLGLADRLVEDWVRRGWVGDGRGEESGHAGRNQEVRHE